MNVSAVLSYQAHYMLSQTTTNILLVASVPTVLVFLISLHPAQYLKNCASHSLATTLSTLSTPCPAYGTRARATTRHLTFLTHVSNLIFRFHGHHTLREEPSISG